MERCKNIDIPVGFPTWYNYLNAYELEIKKNFLKFSVLAFTFTQYDNSFAMLFVKTYNTLYYSVYLTAFWFTQFMHK